MIKSSKKTHRQKAINAEKERRIRLRKEKSPLNQEQMLSLIEYVGGKAIEHGHNNDLSYASEWARKYTIDFDRLCLFLNGENIHDDYELFCQTDPYEFFGQTETRLAWMPLEQKEMSELLEFIDKKLSHQGCDHNYKITEKWLETKLHDTSVVLAALLAKGGGCDCEIVFNIDPEEIYPSTNKNSNLETQKIPQEGQKKKIKRSLLNPFNWDLSKLPKPWKISNLYNTNAPIILEFGKKSGLKIVINTSDIANIKTSSDSFWTQLWCQRYPELENDSLFSISRDQLSLPSGFNSVIIKSPGWTPVICWITLEGVANHLEVQTSSSRDLGDFQEVEKLIFDLCKR